MKRTEKKEHLRTVLCSKSFTSFLFFISPRRETCFISIGGVLKKRFSESGFLFGR